MQVYNIRLYLPTTRRLPESEDVSFCHRLSNGRSAVILQSDANRITVVTTALQYSMRTHSESRRCSVVRL